jgi:benzodiazapine receptor
MMWYESLKKSPLTPPPWVFSVVWPILYILMTSSLVLYITTFTKTLGNTKHRITKTLLSTGVIFFLLQFLFNIAWSPIFFQYRQICFSILIITMLLFFLILTMIEFHKVNVLSFYLLLPYFIWSLFALYLNVDICRQN